MNDDIELRWRELADEFARPFPADELRWRKQGKPSQKGDQAWVAYVDSRAVMDRLDAIAGPGNWEDDYAPGPCGGVLCRLTIHVGSTSRTKADGAANTDIEPIKGGISDAFRRAAVRWGIGRYLYGSGMAWRPASESFPSRASLYATLPAWARADSTRGEPEPEPKPGTAPTAWGVAIKEHGLIGADFVQGLLLGTSPKSWIEVRADVDRWLTQSPSRTLDMAIKLAIKRHADRAIAEEINAAEAPY